MKTEAGYNIFKVERLVKPDREDQNLRDEIKMDLLPMLKEALADAWERGYLKDSRDIDDYRLGGMNMGWEITGPIKAAVQIERVSLDARMR